MTDVTSALVPGVPTASSDSSGSRWASPTRVRAIWYTGLVFVGGAVSGWVWHAMVSLPTFLTSDDGSVRITERAQGQVFAADAVFVIIGMIAGGALGFAAWKLFRHLGWLVAIIAVAGGLVAGSLCWLVGIAQGPRNFAARVATAQPGEKVPIDFALHTTSALLVWALGAIVPVMLYANLSREAETSAGLASEPGQIGEDSAEQPREVVGGKLN